MMSQIVTSLHFVHKHPIINSRCILLYYRKLIVILRAGSQRLIIAIAKHMDLSDMDSDKIQIHVGQNPPPDYPKSVWATK